MNLAKLIEQKNKEENLYLGVKTITHKVTPNMSGGAFDLKKNYENFSGNMASTELERLIVKASSKTSFCFDIGHSSFLSYPIFSLIHIPSYFLGSKALLKWKRGMLSDDTQKKLEEILYSSSNKTKRTLLCLGKIYPISHYEY